MGALLKMIDVERDEVRDVMIDELKSGGVTVFPTDTVYCIGCASSARKAIERIYEIKRRSFSKPLQLLFSSYSQVEQYVELDESFKSLASRFPGRITLIILGKRSDLHAQLQGTHGALGVRVPDDPLITNVIERIGVPIAASSANFSGDPTTSDFSQIPLELIAQVDLAIDGGSANLGIESSVIDCTKEPPEIVREGAVSVEEMRKSLNIE